jgi:trk system potassium uptake protein TrkA
LRDTRFPDGIIVGAILRNHEVVFPRGDTTIETGDRVVLFARANMVKKVEQYFRVSLDFF